VGEFGVLTQERLKELVHYDPMAGTFTRIKLLKGSRAKLGEIKGYSKKEGHLKTCLDGKEYYLARLAHLYMTGSFGEIIDHIDGQPSNNKWANLRNTTKRGNVQNQVKAHHQNKSGLIGAHFRKDKNKYESSITTNGVKKRLGYFNKAEEAHNAYVEAKRLHHPTCSI